MSTATPFPDNWLIAQDFDPKEHIMQIKGKDYFNVQNRLIWFIRDQRKLISLGLAQTSYVIQTDLIEHDREAGWAHFKTYVRDVLGNEATMYGSESMRDFPDYIEKASTKSLGRALLLLGYGTAFTAEMDEGERVVDSPTKQEQRPAQAQQRSAPASAPRSAPATAARTAQSGNPAPLRPFQEGQQPRQASANVQTSGEQLATDRQIMSIRKLCDGLRKAEPDYETLTFAQARDLLTQLSKDYSAARQAS